MKRIRKKDLFYGGVTFFLIVLFIRFLVWGDVGLMRYQKVKQEVEKKEQKLCVLRKELKNIEETILRWKSSPFVIEKMAREELAMGYPGEKVFFLKS